MRIIISTCVTPDYAVAHVFQGGLLVTQARGRNEADAVAAAVSQVRLTRAARRADAADLQAMAAVG